jgi:hypothetical protein
VEPPHEGWAADLGPGRPLEAGTRAGFEHRFGYDFANVRVHDDARAAAAASALSAAAFTAGPHVAFRPGLYRPGTPAGRYLIAHELAHVVQQARAPHASVVQRRSIFEDIAIFLGFSEGEFTRDELLAYLGRVTAMNHIENSYDSDNKARAVVRHYQTGDLAFDLDWLQKALMIKEMLSGPTLSEDEEEIVALLEVSDDQDLTMLFAPGRITVDELESDIGGSARERLDMFFAGRFVGGRDAVSAGNVQPRGYPRRVFDQVALTALIDSGANGVAIAQPIFDLPPVVRERATRWLASYRADLDRRSVDLGRQIGGAPDAAARGPLEAEQRIANARRLNVDVALQRLYRDVAGGFTRHGLRERTAAPFNTPQQRQQIHRATAPEVRVDPNTGAPAPFRNQIPGETLTYEQKMRAALPGIIQGYYNEMVVGRGTAEHADPARTHRLADMERIGNRGKVETDLVFGHLARGNALRADQPGRRGNIHDLFADYEARYQRMDPAERQRTARGQMFYFFSSNARVRALNDHHDASPSFDRQEPRNDEARILARLATEFSDTEEEITRLHHIQRGWPATANSAEGQINIQLFRRATPEADRLFLWDMFQTLIHEYMHTLAHGDYRAYALSFGANSSRYNTLIEGVDTLLSETVWANIASRVTDPGLRRDVEGPAYAAEPAITVPHPSQRRYGSYAEAVRLSQIVGIANLYAAYFLGDVRKIRT